MIISGLEAIEMDLKTHCLVYKQSKTGFFNYIVLHFIDRRKSHNLAIGWDYTKWYVLCLYSKISEGVFHEDVTYQHSLFINNWNNNHY